MCHYIRRIICEYSLFLFVWLSDLIVFNDSPINIFKSTRQFIGYIYLFCLGLKVNIIFVLENLVRHCLILSAYIFKLLVNLNYYMLSIVENSTLLSLFKQISIIANKIVHVFLSNISCLRKYYNTIVFMVLCLVFILIELQKNIFFLKKKIIVARKYTKLTFVYSRTLYSFFNNVKSKLFSR